MENRLAVLQKALEMGADIAIKFHVADHHLSKAQAEELASELGESLGTGYEKCLGHDWFNSKDRWNNQIDFTVYYEASKDEEIQALKERIAQLEKEVTA